MNTRQDIQDELKSMGSILADVSHSMPYSVPVGYFEYFHESVNHIIKDLSEHDKAPGWTKNQPYTLPAAYFETLPEQMLQAAKASETKVIPIKRRHFLKQIKWAAAAILVLGIGLGSYRAFFDISQAPGTESILSSVPNNEIHDYLQHNYRVDIDRVVGNNSINNMSIDNKDIIQYLNETGWD